jgi:PadR family transcriptional regulator PadR
MDTQFKKGVLEVAVLSLLQKMDYYGYELVQIISEKIEISEGTLYPLLRRLKKEGFLKTYMKDSKEGPSRKYYQLTGKGKDKAKKMKSDWRDFVIKIKKLLDE